MQLSAVKLRLLRKQVEKDKITPRADRTASVPASEQQRALWFLDQLIGPGANTAYNVNTVIRFRGDVDISALERALSEIVRRHEVLRTTFSASDGEVVQQVRPAEPVVLLVRDATDDAAAEQLLVEEAARSFDLTGGRLFRAVLVRDHALFLGFHHAVYDGWSVDVLCRELSELYCAYSLGVRPELPELDIQYADFSVWQRDRLASGVFAREFEYWRRQLSGAPALSTVPGDRARPAAASFAGAEVRTWLPDELIKQLGLLGRSHRASLFMVLFSAFQVLLHRYSGQRDLCVGTPVAGRSRAELEPLIGYFVNTVVLRGDLSEDPSFGEYIGRVREVALAAFEHQEVPFDRLVEQLRPDRTLSHPPLFQTMFALQDAGSDRLELPGVRAVLDDVRDGSAKFDLTVVMWPEADGYVAAFEYATDLYDQSTIDGLADDFRSLLESVVKDPDRAVGDFDVRRTGQQVLEQAKTAAPVEYVAPRTPTEQALASLWAGLLGVEQVGVHDDFFALGGHSFTVMRAISRIRRTLGKSIPASALFAAPTVAQLGQRIDEAVAHSPLMPLASGGSKPPLFLVHPVGGSALCYSGLAQGLDRDVRGLIARGLDGADEPLTRIDAMAADYLLALAKAGHRPPFVLGGWSMGGVIAYEMAWQLGEPVPLLLIDSYPPDYPVDTAFSDAALLAWFAEDLAGTLGVELVVTEQEFAALPEPERLSYLLARAQAVNAVDADTGVADLQGMVRMFRANVGALRSYRPSPGYAGPIAVLAAESGWDHGWTRWTTGEVTVRAVPGDHYSVLREPSLPQVISEIQEAW